MKAKVLAAKWDIIRTGVELFIWGATFETTEKADYEKAFGSRKEVKVSICRMESPLSRNLRFPTSSDVLRKSGLQRDSQASLSRKDFDTYRSI